LPLVSYGDLVSKPLEPIPWLVEPLIAKGDRVIVYGEWGAYKSWLLASLALQSAAGRPWLDKFPIATGTNRVLYVDEEMSLRLFTRRLKRLALGMNLTTDSLPLQLLSRYGLRIDNKASIDRFLHRLKESDFDPDVLIIETFRRVFQGDEISAKDVAAFWQALSPITQAGKTVIISHHMRKTGANGRGPIRDRFSGSTDILAGADSALALERKAEDAVIVEHVKCREDQEAKAFAVSFFEEDAEGPVHLRFEGTTADLTSESGKAVQAEQLIRTFLQGAPGHIASTQELLGCLSGQGVKKTTGERALKHLTKQRSLEQPGGRGSYRLVEPS
jgi:RecA-family ATPase